MDNSNLQAFASGCFSHSDYQNHLHFENLRALILTPEHKFTELWECHYLISCLLAYLKMILCFLSFILLPNRLNVLCAFNFQCYRQVTHQINLELICSLFESGGIEISVQVTVLLLTSRFLVCLTDTLARVKNMISPICQPMLCQTSLLTVANFSVNISVSCFPYICHNMRQCCVDRVSVVHMEMKEMISFF